MKRVFCFWLLLAASFVFAASASAQATSCPLGKPCITQADCWGPTGFPLAPCFDCVCSSVPGGPPGQCVDAPSLLSTKCDTDNNICTMEHCNGAGACVPLNPPFALDCVPCVDKLDPCKQGTCDGNGNCEAVLVQDGTRCEADGNECTFETCQGGSCVPGTHAPLPTPCGNVCLDHCDGLGNCVGFQPQCPVGQKCEGKLCATTKHEICENRLDPYGMEHCQCWGELIECCDDSDCPENAANPCIQCIKPAGEPEEVGGNCLCAVGDACPLGGGGCPPPTGQCVEPVEGECVCQE